jgi:hypothetical protein
MKSLSFSDETLKQEKIEFKKLINQLQVQKDNFDSQKFNSNEMLNKTLTQTFA